MQVVRILAGPVVTSALALAAFLVLYANPSIDPSLAAPAFHFWLVSATSLLALLLALAVAVAGGRARDARVVYLGAGLAGLAGFFALHGLSTPGFLVRTAEVAGPAAQLSVLSLGAWMFAGAYRLPRVEGPGLTRLLVAWTAVVLAAIGLGLAWPGAFGYLPIDESPLRWFVTALLWVLLLAAGARFLEGYRLSRSALHLVMLYVVGWLAVTQLIMVMGEVFQLSWWLYHLVLLVAVGTMLITVARQMRRGTLRAGLGALLSDDAERRLAYGMRPEVRALVVATEAKDRYTGGHMQRVAANAVRLGRAMGLGADDLRALAQAGVIHDVGKIEIPDAILNKPGALSEEEFTVIRRHPEVGARIGRELGVHDRELGIIRHHHERWDGAGYPDGLAGEAIPRLARVLSVADVFDAMTSERSYRRPLEEGEALRHIEEGSGSAFDPACVRAWLRLMAPAG
ncbi:MAG: HD-GYP domain-containing protein [Trueperaceae bacterium]|nr:HD-GYP domain-containing protein [Trueperaceae bacterium]